MPSTGIAQNRDAKASPHHYPVENCLFKEQNLAYGLWTRPSLNQFGRREPRSRAIVGKRSRLFPFHPSGCFEYKDVWLSSQLSLSAQCALYFNPLTVIELDIARTSSMMEPQTRPSRHILGHSISDTSAHDLFPQSPPSVGTTTPQASSTLHHQSQPGRELGFSLRLPHAGERDASEPWSPHTGPEIGDAQHSIAATLAIPRELRVPDNELSGWGFLKDPVQNSFDIALQEQGQPGSVMPLGPNHVIGQAPTNWTVIVSPR
jgi:hypothetical protein